MGQIGSRFVDIEVDSTGRIFALDQGNAPFVAPALLEVDPATELTSIVSDAAELSEPTGFAIAEDGDFFVTQPGQVLRVSRQTGAATPISSFGSLTTPQDVVVEAGGTLLVVDQTAQAVLRIDPATGDQTAVVTNPPNAFSCSDSLFNPEDLTMAPGGTLFMSDTLCVNRAVLPAGTISEVLYDLGVGILTGITSEPGGGDLLVTDSTKNAVYRINPTTGMRSTVTAGIQLDAPSDLAVATVPEPGATPCAWVLLTLAASRRRSRIRANARSTRRVVR